MSTPAVNVSRELVARRAIRFAAALNEAAIRCSTEEDIRAAAIEQLALFQEETGIRLEGRHELRVGGGRPDSLYQRVVIEYKNPKSAGDHIGNKGTSAGSRKVITQIKSRFQALQIEQGQPITALFGVGLDGKNIVFVRFRSNKWDIYDPAPLTPTTAGRLLWALLNLNESGKPFDPESLAAEFGAEANLTKECIPLLYSAITTTTNKRAQMFFQQWKILFGEVCGYDIGHTSENVRTLAKYYGIHLKGLRSAELLFALHTYYALFIKFIAAEIVVYYHAGIPNQIKKLSGASSSKRLRDGVIEFEKGGIFKHLGITNFLEGDLFAWYPEVWTEDIERCVRSMVEAIEKFNPATLSSDPSGSRDLLKGLYQGLFPRSIRHSLGEYYTPDWLAEEVMEQSGYTGEPNSRLLDPACGSGTFLVAAINKVRLRYEQERESFPYDEGELCRKILENIVGFDLNPLAVMAARVNYLIALDEIIALGRVGTIEIPVYLCDSVGTPSKYGGLFAESTEAAKNLSTSVAEFIVPTEITSTREQLALYVSELEHCVVNQYSAEEFIQRVKEAGLPCDSEQIHRSLFTLMRTLSEEGKNGIWARIIKNHFAPLFTAKFDYVVGNPPWIRWGYLPKEYREKTIAEWTRYGLFSLKGFDSRLGSGEKDFSQLFTYSCIDHYLKERGRLAFIITQTVFKAKGQAEGFRRFRLGEDGAFIRIHRVHDLSAIRPFEGATNLTVFFVAEKGRKTSYPVPYTVWLPKKGSHFPESSSLAFVKAAITRADYQASPMAVSQSSAWMTAPGEAGGAIAKVLGKSEYKAVVGARTEPYGVYQLRILQNASASSVLVENCPDQGKKRIKQVQAEIEQDLVFPLIRGRDVQRWAWAAEYHVLMTQDPHTRRGYSETWMKRTHPKAFAYLKQFQTVLEDRAAFKKYHEESGHAFYSMFNISEDTFANYKVVWRRMGAELKAAVVIHKSGIVSEAKVAIPSDTTAFVAFANADSANYFLGLINSIPVRGAIYSISAAGRGLGTPSVINSLQIVRYDAGNDLHNRIASSALRLTELHSQDIPSFIAIDKEENELAGLAAEYWNISPVELDQLRQICMTREAELGHDSGDGLNSQLFVSPGEEE